MCFQATSELSQFINRRFLAELRQLRPLSSNFEKSFGRNNSRLIPLGSFRSFKIFNFWSSLILFLIIRRNHLGFIDHSQKISVKNSKVSFLNVCCRIHFFKSHGRIQSNDLSSRCEIESFLLFLDPDWKILKFRSIYFHLILKLQTGKLIQFIQLENYS